MNLPLAAKTDAAARAQPLTQAERRRTFAIIAHPDAGKTTLTEKLLLLGGAIQEAGAVRARGERRRTRSDWMKIEQQRGISVSASVMTFEHDGLVFNLLDTPGHQDFSEDTYRTLTAVDSAVMVLDAAKGIESQTLKLFEVCRLRDVPIITFINKIRPRGAPSLRADGRNREDACPRRRADPGRPLGAAADYPRRLLICWTTASTSTRAGPRTRRSRPGSRRRSRSPAPAARSSMRNPIARGI